MSDTVIPDLHTIGAYLRSREGKRWRNEDTRAILARAAEIDCLVERLLGLRGFGPTGISESKTGSAFALGTTARAS